ncbi:MAG: hypothetical protein F6K30_25695 [Cyanothece sp. SIO2G6]|nr:hypothetical protein [Cyanothece sp. SIO2G6]
MFIYVVYKQLCYFALCIGLLLPVAVIYLVGSGSSLGQLQASAATGMSEPYCQFQDNCSTAINLKGTPQSEPVDSYCQFRESCSPVNV